MTVLEFYHWVQTKPGLSYILLFICCLALAAFLVGLYRALFVPVEDPIPKPDGTPYLAFRDGDPPLTKEFMDQHLHRLAEKHPALLVRQLCRELYEARSELKRRKR